MKEKRKSEGESCREIEKSRRDGCGKGKKGHGAKHDYTLSNFEIRCVVIAASYHKTCVVYGIAANMGFSLRVMKQAIYYG